MATMKAITGAYTKGVRAFRKHSHSKFVPVCPYGDSKREMRQWWLSGYHDAEIGTVDGTMLRD